MNQYKIFGTRKNSSLKSIDEMREFVEHLEEIIETIFFVDDTANNLMYMIRYLREMLTEEKI